MLNKLHGLVIGLSLLLPEFLQTNTSAACCVGVEENDSFGLKAALQFVERAGLHPTSVGFEPMDCGIRDSSALSQYPNAHVQGSARHSDLSGRDHS